MNQKQYWEKQAAEGWMPRDWDYPWPKKIGPFVLDRRPGSTPHPLTANYHAEARRENEEGEWVYMVAEFQIDWAGGDTGFDIWYEGEAGGFDSGWLGPVRQNAARKTKEGALDVVRRQVAAITRNNRKRLPDWLETIRGTGLK